ncbi:alanine racemase [Marinobacter sp. X15-166B]|uniref:alanine racemase n=1 Tax=Marinobacter sp. X15-166B TaxID=1897620 RepID=UPI00085C960C|nr:alanine racemase [Marinobacter sp. X15-166B]OEY67419.1 alanine racemase [Marinobacter sp. X15-166B]
MARPAVAEIRLDNLRANYQLAASLAPHGQTVAVVKADAYGHGAAEVTEYLAREVGVFAVACIEEAMALRTAGLRQPILLLEGFFEAEELDVIAREGFWTVVHNQEQLHTLATRSLSRPVPVWLKVDTGMHRLGFSPAQAVRAYDQLKSLRQVKNLVVMTHLANADDCSAPGVSVATQVARLPATFLEPTVELSLANSAGLLAHEQVRAHWQRPGIMLYGASPLTVDNPDSAQLRPVMTLKSKVIATRWTDRGAGVGYGGRFLAERPTRVGTVAMGYADGYPRQANDGTPVLVDGQRTRLIGRVSMDMLTVDLTDLPAAGVGSEVEFWGETLSANEVAAHCDTIAYHLFTGVTRRVPRKYLG